MKFFFFYLLLLSLVIINISSRFTLTKRKYQTYLRRFWSWPTQKHNTPPNDEGRGATIYLDRHNVDCKTGALSGFHLQRVGGGKFKYDFTCIYPKDCKEPCQKKIEQIDKKKCKKISTPLNDLGNQFGKSTNYLDRHQLKCPVGFVMTQFHLQRKPPKIKYDYTCCPAKVKDCSAFNSKNSDFGDYANIYLDRQNIQTPSTDTQAITGFKLNTNYGAHAYTYTVSYCAVSG